MEKQKGFPEHYHLFSFERLRRLGRALMGAERPYKRSEAPLYLSNHYHPEHFQTPPEPSDGEAWVQDELDLSGYAEVADELR